MNEKIEERHILSKLCMISTYAAAISLLSAGALILYGTALHQYEFFINIFFSALFALIALVFYGRGRGLRRLHPDAALNNFLKWDLIQQLGILMFCLMLLAMSIHRVFNEGYAIFG